jgi:prepilin-type N-terminal cleavage/methylation domain-containing protein
METLAIPRRTQAGFTLAEMAIALAIIGLLLGGLVTSLSVQVQQRAFADTRRTLEQARDALIGFAIANGRLPCPASSTSNGAESYTGTVGNSQCSASLAGFLPAATLGLSPTDSQGYLVDAWGNRIRYAVTQTNSYAFTNSSIAGTYIRKDLSSLTPDLQVCASFTCVTSEKIALASPAVIFSVGKNGSQLAQGTSGGSDENKNNKIYTVGSLVADTSSQFVYHEPTFSNAGDATFDDVVVWLSPNVLYNRMAAAGAF